ncbi:hemin ABC transporter substrate-binding protein [Thiomicrospira sp. WB1]|uniref:heme/hemin ABC transporter substrate-binding protein n=1 Tax=Thiomicrospira sp. WB1 TaxID=1685380 RepID=UPI00074A66CD|nr:ABC transporter substrate-binding protein [Thiomicrospira sp. WB1]KUJ71068.1 hypothetical protein AVO41_09360 [Thiomicrospira sp. WB1]
MRFNHSVKHATLLWFVALFCLIVLLFGFSHKANATDRIVAIDGAVTEIIYALDEADRLVGRDTTSTYPPEAESLPDVGYMRQLSAEGILSLKPNLIIATEDARPIRVLTQLKQAGITVHTLNNDYSAKGTRHKIQQVAGILGAEQAGERVIQQFDQQLSQARNQALAQRQKEGPQQAIFLLNIRGGNMMAAGRETRADTLMKLAGLENPARDAFKSYKPLSAEAAIDFNPDVIITFAHTLEAMGGKQALLNHPAIRLTQAGRQQNLVVIEGADLNFGPHLGQAVQTLSQKVRTRQGNEAS